MKPKKQPKGFGRTEDDLAVILQSGTRQTTLSGKETLELLKALLDSS